MEFQENFSQIENLEEGKERYEENLKLLEKAKNRFVEMGIFEKDFVNSLDYVFIDESKKEESELNSYELASDGKIIPLELDEKKLTSTKISYIFSKDLSENFFKGFDTLSQQQDERHQSTILWMESVDFKKFYSFDAVMAHETAHTKSYASITENNSLLFDKEKFRCMVSEIVQSSEYPRKMESIDFTKFEMSVYNWSELYALLYQREFLRRENSDNIKLLEGRDNHIVEVASDLQGAMEKFNQKKDTNIDPEIIYKDGHAFSFLLASFFEEKYKDFDERIKILEQCKKE